jgi:hypothetical protein
MKKLIEVVDIYDYVDFKDRKVGSSTPSKDNINTSLLNDINVAAKRAGVKVDVTTAVSGHREKTSIGNVSRHTTGNAVDISIINGTSVRNINKRIIDKFVGELVKMGYVRGKESGNPKAVLDYTFKGGGHEGHIHISNTSNMDSNYDDKINLGDDKEYVELGLIDPQFNFIDFIKKNIEEDISRIKKLL